ncbi:MAG: OmpA family protein [Bacteroidia bacterium]|jgi:outer membrane protein OmpA-like peptidoglycan-associated protein
MLRNVVNLLCLFLLSSISIAQTDASTFVDYKPSYTKFQDNYILDKIEYSSSEIIFHFRYIANGDFGAVNFYGKKGEAPWCLKSGKKYYPMKKVTDIYCNGKLKSKKIPLDDVISFQSLKGEVYTCKIHFDKLPAGITQADLIEGKGHELSYNHFNCLKIKLKSLDSKDLGTEQTMQQNIDAFNKTNGKTENASIVLKNVQFNKGSAELLPQSYGELNKLGSYLKANPTVRVQISGHTCNTGNPESNVTLSKNRAQAVQDYLIKMGVQASQLSVTGYGGSMPLVANTSDANKQKNRRVEFKVLEN